MNEASREPLTNKQTNKQTNQPKRFAFIHLLLQAGRQAVRATG